MDDLRALSLRRSLAHGRDPGSKTLLPKAIKRALRELAGRAHETLLRRALTDLRREFDAWERSEIDAFELTERVHKFHQGPAQEIYLRFSGGIGSPLPRPLLACQSPLLTGLL